MRTYRNNPESLENTQATLQANREAFALAMQARPCICEDCSVATDGSKKCTDCEEDTLSD